MITQSRIFEVYEDKTKRRLYTVNLAPGKQVYEERLVREKGIEYREWDPKRSKLASCILKGCQNVFIRKNDIVLYLGASTGTTVSHVSDIVGSNGFVFALDFAPRVVRELVFLAEQRKNIAPLLEDAARPETFYGKVSQADILYMDIAQRSQADIFLRNMDWFLKPGGYGLFAVKARSIDITKRPRELFEAVRKQLEQKATIIDYRTLEPFQLDHCMFIVKKK